MPLEYDKQLIPNAQSLRKDMTRQERHLWYDFLSTYSVRFQRQKTIGQYIVDFYCHRAKLAVELDGSQHYTQEAMDYDLRRSEALNAQGVKVLRFTNTDIDRNFEAVCEAIFHAVLEGML
jgi:very-short-patch-repair endonuclease